MKKQLYKARWAQAGAPAIASVDFYASHNTNALRRACKIGRELGVRKSTLTLTVAGKLIISNGLPTSLYSGA